MTSVSTAHVATGAGLMLHVANKQSYTYTVTGTFSGTWVIEYTKDHTNFIEVATGTGTQVAVTIVVDQIDNSAVFVRSNMTAYSSGTCTVVNADVADPVQGVAIVDAEGVTIFDAVDGGITMGGTLDVTGTATVPDILGGDTSLGIVGAAPASATSAGGAIASAGGIGGSTSGAGGAVSQTGGAGTTNAVGGAASSVGGAGQGTGAGGVSSVTGGGSGAGSTGNGGASSQTGGAALSTNGTGGAVSTIGGVATGTGTGGAVVITGGASAGASGTSGAVTIDSGAVAGGTGDGVLIGDANAVGVTIGAPFNYAAGGGSADVQTLTLNPAATRYVTGMLIAWRATADNTGACTMNVNGLGAKSVKTQTGADPAAGDLQATTGLQLAMYDGTNFVLINPGTTTD